MGYYSQLDIEIQNQRWLHNTVLTELLHNTVLTELLDYMRNKTEEEYLESQLENYHEYLFDIARVK